MIQHFHQVVFCSERENRAFFREISIAPRNAWVTSVEKLPPHYEIPIGNMRDENEGILRMEDASMPLQGYGGCPYCENVHIFYCDECGKISCSKGASTHYCPGCQKIHKTEICHYNFMSKSVLLAAPHERTRLNGPSGHPAPRMERGDFERQFPGPEKIKMLDNVRKFLEGKNKFQIEDRRGNKF